MCCTIYFPWTRLPQVEEKIGLKRSHIYLLMKEGRFLKPLMLGPRAVVWRLEEIDEWIKQFPRTIYQACLIAVQLFAYQTQRWGYGGKNVNQKKKRSRTIVVTAFNLASGAETRNRTRDTRIFSPLLYRLSYLGTKNCLLAQTLRCAWKFYPRHIKYMPAGKFPHAP